MTILMVMFALLIVLGSTLALPASETGLANYNTIELDDSEAAVGESN